MGLLDEVALRKESVDRNLFFILHGLRDIESLSARRAWIEIGKTLSMIQYAYRVALRKESVDRNFNHLLRCSYTDSRSPQGERG